MSLTKLPALFFCCLLAIAGSIPLPLRADMLHVDGAAGNDQAAGTEQAPLRTIQRAADIVKSGDTIMVRPGIYFESVQLRARGTKEKPIVIKAGGFGLGKVVVTGARQDVRTGRVKWELFDKTTDTYRIPHQGGFPARMLYDDVDLFPYPNLEMLQAFQSPLAPEPRPRPRHGYTYDETSGYLYVRLHPDGKYGSSDPNAHKMAVAPPVAGGFDGTLIRKQADYGIGILGNGPAFVIIDGITLETPAVAGVFTEGSDVTVRNCWFRGCRTGVSGSYEDRLADPAKGYEDFFNHQYSPELLDTCAARVVIENCDFTQKPCVDDAAEVLASLPDETDPVKLKRGGMAKKGGIYALWIRKDSVNGGLPSEKFKYEIGVANRIGRDWILRGNYIHNVFEGISCHATSASEGLQVLYNVFEGACDNAIELEDHSVGMVIRGNVLRNCLEPISYQPLRGEPWPHSAVIEKNLIYNAPDDLYAQVRINGAFKWGITRKNWDLPAMQDRRPEKGAIVVLPGTGVNIRNNAILFHGGMLIKNVNGIDIKGYKMSGNVIIAESLIGNRAEKDKQYWAALMAFSGNYCAPDKEGSPGPEQYTAGPEGKVFPSIQALTDSSDALSILHLAGLKRVIKPGELPALKTDEFLVANIFVFQSPPAGPRHPVSQ